MKGDLKQPAFDRLLAGGVPRFDRLCKCILQGFVGQVGISQDAHQKEPHLVGVALVQCPDDGGIDAALVCRGQMPTPPSKVLRKYDAPALPVIFRFLSRNARTGGMLPKNNAP